MQHEKGHVLCLFGGKKTYIELGNNRFQSTRGGAGFEAVHGYGQAFEAARLLHTHRHVGLGSMDRFWENKHEKLQQAQIECNMKKGICHVSLVVRRLTCSWGTTGSNPQGRVRFLQLCYSGAMGLLRSLSRVLTAYLPLEGARGWWQPWYMSI